jgi:hypothetical protein
MSKSRSTFEWWRSTKGSGYYHERSGGKIKNTSDRYTRARDAKRAAMKDAARVGAKVIEIARPIH